MSGTYGKRVELHSSGRTYIWYPMSKHLFTKDGGLISNNAFNREDAYRQINQFRKANQAQGRNT